MKARGAAEGLSSKLMLAVIAGTLPPTGRAAVVTYNNVFSLKTLGKDHFYLDIGCMITYVQ